MLHGLIFYFVFEPERRKGRVEVLLLSSLFTNVSICVFSLSFSYGTNMAINFSWFIFVFLIYLNKKCVFFRKNFIAECMQVCIYLF